MCYQYGMWYIDMVVYHIDMVVLDIAMGYRVRIWEMTASIRSSWISIRDIVSLCVTSSLNSLLACQGGNTASVYGY